MFFYLQSCEFVLKFFSLLKTILHHNFLVLFYSILYTVCSILHLIYHPPHNHFLVNILFNTVLCIQIVLSILSPPIRNCSIVTLSIDNVLPIGSQILLAWVVPRLTHTGRIWEPLPPLYQNCLLHYRLPCQNRAARHCAVHHCLLCRKCPLHYYPPY